MKKSAGTRSFREAISKAQSSEAVKELILNFPIEHLEQSANDQMENDCDQECGG